MIEAVEDPGVEGLSHWEGEPVRIWEALWGVPRFEAYLRLGSTNDRLRRLADAGATAFTVVTAEEQTSGRGRNGRAWASAPSRGLWTSLLLRPPTPEARLLAPIAVGLAVCRAVEHLAPELEPRLKWPNDVLLGGRKLCGILCEAGGQDSVVAGVGLNVGHTPADFPPGIRGSAVSLAMATGREVPRGRLMGELLRSLRTLVSRGGPVLSGALAEEVARRDALLGKRVEVAHGPRGIASGIDEGGRLKVAVRSGEIVTVVAGSVSILEG